MKSVWVFIVFVSFSFFAVFGTASAISLTKDFAGQIIDKKATRIRVLESSGYKCVVPGKTVQIRSVGVTGYQPTSYFIPLSSLTLWRGEIKTGKQILGQYSGKFPIVCTNGNSAQTVTLPMVGMYGTTGK